MVNSEGRARKRWDKYEDEILVTTWNSCQYLDDMAGRIDGRDIPAMAARAGMLRKNGVDLKKLKRRPAYKPDFKALGSMA